MLRALLVSGALAWQQAGVPRSGGAPCCTMGADTAAAWTDLVADAQRLTSAQVARTVASVCTEGALCTRLTDAGGDAIFTSQEAYITDASGCVLVSLAGEQSSANLGSNGEATFHMRAPRGGAAAGSSLTLVGSTEAHSADDVSDADLIRLSEATGAEVQAIAARSWVRLAPERVHLHDAVRGVEEWVPTTEYAEAESNPLAGAASSLLTKINGAEHAESLRRFAAVYSGARVEQVGSVELLGVDQLGFDLRADMIEGDTKTLRVGFRLPPANEEEGVSAFMKLFQEAYERQQGWM